MLRRTLIAVLGVAIVATGALLARPATSAGPSVAKLCDGQEPTVQAAPGQAVIEGTPGDDWVVLTEGVSFKGHGGTDTICNSAGQVEAIAVPFEDAVIEANKNKHPSETGE